MDNNIKKLGQFFVWSVKTFVETILWVFTFKQYEHNKNKMCFRVGGTFRTRCTWGKWMKWSEKLYMLRKSCVRVRINTSMNIFNMGPEKGKHKTSQLSKCIQAQESVVLLFLLCYFGTTGWWKKQWSKSPIIQAIQLLTTFRKAAFIEHPIEPNLRGKKKRLAKHYSPALYN